MHFRNTEAKTRKTWLQISINVYVTFYLAYSKTAEKEKGGKKKLKQVKIRKWL